jgi:hypothetical protein
VAANTLQRGRSTPIDHQVAPDPATAPLEERAVVSTTAAGSEVPAGDDARDHPPAESTSGALPRWELLPHAQDPREPFFDVATEVDGGAVTIVVQDHGQWRPPTSDNGRGRGLAMMHVLADINVATRGHGTTVTIRNISATPSP